MRENTTMPRPNMNEAFRRSIVKQRKLSETRYTTLVNAAKRSLNEGKNPASTRVAILDEAIKLERLVILEAMSHMDPEDTVEQARGMADAAQTLSDHLGIYDLGDKVAEMYNNTMDAYGSASSANKGAMSSYMKGFSDLAVVTKGLMALADECSAVNGSAKTGTGGPVADTLRSALGMSGQNQDATLKTILTTTDKELSADNDGKKPGLLSRIAGSGREKGTDARWKAAVADVLKTSAPGFAKLIDVASMAEDIEQHSVPDIIMAFSYYDSKALKVVDNEMLTSMTKKSMWQGLKDTVGSFFNGSGAMKVGRSY